MFHSESLIFQDMPHKLNRSCWLHTYSMVNSVLPLPRLCRVQFVLREFIRWAFKCCLTKQGFCTMLS